MGLFSIGERDQDGRQKRIEHRGEYLRASRTGGVSLRAQTRMAGVNATVSSRHGVRLSTRLARNTQVALQNGRFVLRGRYGSDAAKVNLSKSGVTVSTRTPSGTVNWVRPGRSSFKLAGVQVRGRKAVWLQLIHMLVTLAVSLAQWLATLTMGAINAAGALAGRAQRRREAAAEAAALAELEAAPALAAGRAWLASQALELAHEPPRDLLAALVFALAYLGRGQVVVQSQFSEPGATTDAAGAALHADLTTVAATLWRTLPEPDAAHYGPAVLVLAGQLAHALATHLDTAERAELLLALDDACLVAGPRTLLQQAMLDSLSERWQVALVLEGEQ